ncbi:MAG: RcnB family protein [Alphaproteobacteria bacterium]
MKRLILAITAASLLSGTAAMAAPYRDYRNYDAHRAVAHVDYRHHDFRRGERLPVEWRRGPAIDWRVYHLRQPPHGYYWVRAHNDFALVTRSNGLIVDLQFAR